MLEERKGMDILLLDIRAITILADYFVICTANSERHLRALAEDLPRQLKGDIDRPIGIEGEPESGWVLIDCGDVVVHLFSADRRVFYDLEGLWKEAQKVVHIQ